MIIEEAYYKLTEHELKELLEYKGKWLKEYGYETPNPSDWEYIDTYNIAEELKNYIKIPEKRI